VVRIRWEPPAALKNLLLEAALKSRDKVELVIAYYSLDHGGNAPSMKETADVLGIARQNVERRILELIAEGRAERLDGKLILRKSSYSHPALADLPVQSGEHGPAEG
jgi:hypothetical protein